MWLGRISRVAALAKKLPAFHSVPWFYLDGSVLKMRQDRNFVIAVLNDDAVADTRIRIHRTGLVVPHTCNHLGYCPVCRCQHIPAKSEVILVFGSIPASRLAIRGDTQQIERKSLVRHVVMVIQLTGVAAPKNEPFVMKWQGQRGLMLFRRRFRRGLRLKE